MKYLEKVFKGFFKDHSGVTPVVGVILMVAVTVVMGAVIAGFVYGYVGTTQKGPLVGLSIVDNPDPSETTNFSLLIKHTGGESVAAGDWKLSVTKERDSGTGFVFASEAAATTPKVIDVANAEIYAGRTLKVQYTTDNFTTLSPPAGPQTTIKTGWYHVVITHAPSNSLMLDTNVQVR